MNPRKFDLQTDLQVLLELRRRLRTELTGHPVQLMQLAQYDKDVKEAYERLEDTGPVQ